MMELKLVHVSKKFLHVKYRRFSQYRRNKATPTCGVALNTVNYVPTASSDRVSRDLHQVITSINI